MLQLIGIEPGKIGALAILCTCSLLSIACQNIPASAAKPTSILPPNPDFAPATRTVRATGTIQALRSFSIRVPQITSQNSRVTLVTLIPNGTKVKKGDLLVEFDQTTLIDEARDAKAKINDLAHQLEERRAQVQSEASKRTSKLREAEADLAKAEIQLRKGPILSDIDRRKNEVKAQSARERLASYKKSGAAWELSEAASVRGLELKLDRQKLALERIENSMKKLSILAPTEGMAALENTWRNGSMGPPQEGDQMWPGQPVLRIFDPSQMIVETAINEPDFAVASENAKAIVYLDAYPGARFDGLLESASPVATAGLDSPVRSFAARFRLQQLDPRLLPDLSASLEISAGASK